MAMFAFVLTFDPTKTHPEPAYVQPAALVLAALPAILAIAQILRRFRSLRTVSLWSFVADAGAVLALIGLYAFDPGRKVLALIVVVQAEGGLLFGLPGALWAWAATSAASVAIEFLSVAEAGSGFGWRDLTLRRAAGVRLAIGRGALAG